MIIAANTSSTTRVAVYTPHRKLAGHLHRVVARAGGGDDRCPRASILSITVNLPAIQSTPVTSFERVISGVSSLARVAWGRTVERSRTIFAPRFVPVFPVNAGTSVRDLNLRGAFSALRSLLLRSLVQHPEKSGRSVAQTFRLSPVPVLSLATVHAVNLSEDRKHEVPKKCGF